MIGIVAAHFAVLSSSFITPPTEGNRITRLSTFSLLGRQLGVVSYGPQLSYVTGRPAAEDLRRVVVDKIYRMFVHKKLLNAVFGPQFIGPIDFFP